MKIKSNPVVIFDRWFNEAKNLGIKDYEAMNLATATKEGIPSNRMVLLKSYDENGFVFFTNLESKKGIELRSNPFVSLCFYWKELDRQVRIEGRVLQVSDEEADKYFDSRLLQSRVGACISKQSRVIEGDFDLLKEVSKKTLLMMGKKIKRPSYWSGFSVSPCRIEFWQKGEFRIHLRQSYHLENDGWQMEFLYP